MSSTRQRERRNTAAGVLVGLVGALGHFSGCGLPTEGTRDVGGSPCNTVADCDDKNLCTEKICTEQKLCSITPKTSGGPDDANDCTVDTCAAGVETHAPESDGAACKAGVGKGVCASGGCVVNCMSDAVCDDQNSCTTDHCDLGLKACVHGKLDGPEPGVTPKKGDCVQALCVQGVPKVVSDDTDLPDPGDCTKATCAAGTLTISNLAAETGCGMNGTLKCDGKGVCANCASDGDCSVPQSCQTPACKAGSCVPKFAAAGTTPDDQQTANDCQKMVCDGSGNPGSQPDNMDAPKDDGNPCTAEVCIMGAPQHSPTVGAMCSANGGQFCDALGACVQCLGAADCTDNTVCTGIESCSGGNCAPGMPLACNDGNTCTADSCDALSGCVYAAMNGSSCDDDNMCTTMDACVGSTCTGGLAPSCDDGNACTNDSCNPANGCQHANNSVSCDDGDGCTTNDRKCSGGVCSGTPKNCGGTYTCSNNACETCSDGIKNGSEQGVDCAVGVFGCKRCSGDACNWNNQCKSGTCDNTHKCT